MIYHQAGNYRTLVEAFRRNMGVTMFDRRVTGAVREALAWAPVVLVDGARQVGKSVLVREILGVERPAHYVTFDDALQLAAALANPQDFVLGLPDPVTLDEVQRAPEVFRAIKLSVDQDRRPGRFLLTGSANVLLLPWLSDSLAGRMRRVTLWPLSQGEIEGRQERFLDLAFDEAPLPGLTAGGSRTELVARLTRGGFPEAVALPAGPVRDGWMRDYLSTVLDRDVRDISAVGDRVGLPRLLQILAARSGTLLNASALSRESGIARGTIDRYTALFTMTFTLRFVPAWAGDIARRLMKAPKILFSDSGLAAHLAGLDATRLAREPDRLGSLLETFVGGELARQATWTNRRVALHHYRDSSGAEVDWVLEDAAGQLVGIEVKATTAPSAHDFRGLRAFSAAVGHRFHRGILLHTGQQSVPLGDRLWALPVEALWRLGTHGG
jgi:predicted AAA+ superfamily ATPase